MSSPPEPTPAASTAPSPHTFATVVRKDHGLEAAQVLLGHARADVTPVYAERNEELAAQVLLGHARADVTPVYAERNEELAAKVAGQVGKSGEAGGVGRG